MPLESCLFDFVKMTITSVLFSLKVFFSVDQCSNKWLISVPCILYQGAVSLDKCEEYDDVLSIIITGEYYPAISIL